MNALTGAFDWLGAGKNWRGDTGVQHRLIEHLGFTGLSMLVACLIALPVALWLGHLGKGGALAVNISNIGRAIPTLALLALLSLTPLREHGETPTLIALVLFAIPPVLTNAYIGMREADRAVVEAARGMGMSGGQVFLRVELPLAFPLLMTGIRSAAVQTVATATLAAIPGGGGLGRVITAGFNLQNTSQVVAGALLVAALALLVEGLLVLVARWADPMRHRRTGGTGTETDGGAGAAASGGTESGGGTGAGAEPAAAAA
ncbi:ABC transporter permease [Streptomyces sp. AM 3-1-1]|uniref:ABC transporter permease n=1 Tax=Streptomyces sp. AM 3-1-1 TaxID=3028711 RepID=UPI0023BA2002|nr:ABC transporter permease [Streptomyces sp. AM 3-1-1]WEH28993.1 ABC transporter permease [Streptomyces sp. AM 3-1-1]